MPGSRLKFPRRSVCLAFAPIPKNTRSLRWRASKVATLPRMAQVLTDSELVPLDPPPAAILHAVFLCRRWNPARFSFRLGRRVYRYDLEQAGKRRCCQSTRILGE